MAAFASAPRSPAWRSHEHKSFGKVWPGVLEAVNLIGSKQVQGRASAGGNLCNGSPAGDSVPAMVAAGAIVTVQGPNGRREIKVEDVPAGPGRTNLKPGEILVSFTLPPRPPGSSDAYLRMIPRTEMDIAVVGVGVSLTIKDGTVTAARVGLGAVAPTVLLVEDAAKALIGSKLDDAALAKAAAACSAACRPIDDKRGTIAYRTKVAGVLLKRTAAIAAKRAHRESKVHGQSSRHHHHQRRADGIPVRADRHHARRAARAAGAHRLQGRLRLRRLRRLLDHARRSPDLLLPDARGRSRRPRDPHHRGHGATARSCIRCSRNSSKWPRCNAASAPRACWSPPTRCCKQNPNPSEEEVRFWLAGNLCRCTGYDKIVRAVMETAAEMRAQ